MHYLKQITPFNFKLLRYLLQQIWNNQPNNLESEGVLKSDNMYDKHLLGRIRMCRLWGVKFFSNTNLIFAFVWQGTYRFIRLWRSGQGVRSDIFSGPEYYVCHREWHGARKCKGLAHVRVFLRTYLGCFLKKIVVGVKSSRWRVPYLSYCSTKQLCICGWKVKDVLRSQLLETDAWIEDSFLNGEWERVPRAAGHPGRGGHPRSAGQTSHARRPRHPTC
jgi:hypothetical protein